MKTFFLAAFCFLNTWMASHALPTEPKTPSDAVRLVRSLPATFRQKHQLGTSAAEKRAIFRTRATLVPNSKANHSTGRVAAAAAPDSVLMEDFSTGTFEPVYSYRFVRNSAGKLTQMRLWLPPSPPMPAFQFGSAEATYSTQGALTRLSFFVTFPTTTEAFRLLQPVDSRGNCTSAKMYEEDTATGSLVLTGGDSLQYTYTGNTISSFIAKGYDADNAIWVNGLRVTAISNNAAGQPTGFDVEFWNDSTNAWDPGKLRYSELTWNAGFDSWFALFGSEKYMPNAEAFLREGFKDLPRVAFWRLLGQPDQYVMREFNGSTFVNSERAYSVVSGGLIQRVTYQTWTGTGWESHIRDVYTWTGTKLTMAVREDSSSGSWQIPSSNAYRNLWAYNGNGDLTSETGEYRDSVGAPWLLDWGNQYAIVYQPTNASRIQTWLEKDYSFNGPTGSGAWDTTARYTLYYSTASSTCPGCEGDLALGIYPNPFSDQIHINGLSQEAQWCITDLNGRLFAQGDQRPEESGTSLNNIACQAWPAGIYMLQVWDAEGNRSWHRLVKR